MDTIEIKKKQAELNRVQAARLDIEIMISEFEQKIIKARKDVLIQESKERELTEQIKKMKEKDNGL